MSTRIWIPLGAISALLGACDPHAESAGADNSTESGTTGSATDEGPTTDATGRTAGDSPGETVEQSPSQDQQSPQPAER